MNIRRFTGIRLLSWGCLCLLVAGSQPLWAQGTASTAKSLAEAQYDLQQAAARRATALKEYHTAQDQVLQENMSDPELEHAQQQLSAARKAYNVARMKALDELETKSADYRESKKKFEAMEDEIKQIHQQEPSEKLEARLDELVDEHVALFDHIQSLELHYLQETGVDKLRQDYIAANNKVREMTANAHEAVNQHITVTQARERYQATEYDFERAQRQLMGSSAAYTEAKQQQLLQQQRYLPYGVNPGWYGYYYSPYGGAGVYRGRGLGYPGGFRGYIR